MNQYEYLVHFSTIYLQIGFDIAENELSEVCCHGLAPYNYRAKINGSRSTVAADVSRRSPRGTRCDSYRTWGRGTYVKIKLKIQSKIRYNHAKIELKSMNFE